MVSILVWPQSLGTSAFSLGELPPTESYLCSEAVFNKIQVDLRAMVSYLLTGQTSLYEKHTSPKTKNLGWSVMWSCETLLFIALLPMRLFFRWASSTVCVVTCRACLIMPRWLRLLYTIKKYVLVICVKIISNYGVIFRCKRLFVSWVISHIF